MCLLRDCEREVYITLCAESPGEERRNSDKRNPPSPAVAARLVSSVLRSKSQGARSKPLVALRPPPPEDNSTETEDSDDSAGEQEEKGEWHGKGEEPEKGMSEKGSVSSKEVPGRTEEIKVRHVYI